MELLAQNIGSILAIRLFAAENTAKQVNQMNHLYLWIPGVKNSMHLVSYCSIVNNEMANLSLKT